MLSSVHAETNWKILLVFKALGQANLKAFLKSKYWILKTSKLIVKLHIINLAKIFKT